MIRVGQKVRFDPFKYMTYLGVNEDRTVAVEPVCYVNEKHSWFQVEHNGVKVSFKFADIGKDVKIIE